MSTTRAAVAAHTHRVRAAGGKRTSVDLTPAALVALDALRTPPIRSDQSRSTGNRLSTSETICNALITAHHLQLATGTLRNLTEIPR